MEISTKISKNIPKLKKREILGSPDLNFVNLSLSSEGEIKGEMMQKITKQDKYEINQRNGFYMWAYNSSINTVQNI